MPESRHEQIVVAALAVLAAAGGHYTPDHVFRHPTFDGTCYGKDYRDVIYVLVPDRTERQPNTNKTLLARMLFDVVALRRLPVPYSDVNPLSPPAEPRSVIQSRLAEDVENKLTSDPTYAAYAGLEVWDIQVTTDERDADLTDLEGWACAYLRTQVQYYYRRGAA